MSSDSDHLENTYNRNYGSTDKTLKGIVDLICLRRKSIVELIYFTILNYTTQII